jgi:hypothetical protein
VAFRIRKLRLDVDRAAFNRVETNEDVVGLECLADLVVSVYEEKILRKVGVVAPPFFRLFFFLGDVDAKIFIYQVALFDLLGRSNFVPALHVHVVESDRKLSGRVAVLRGDPESH